LKLRSVGETQIQEDVIASHAANMTRMITKGNLPLGSVDVHRVLITDAASETNAVKLSSVLQ